MPVMDGQATISALQFINPEIKIIGSSGLDSNFVTPKANGTKARHFIPKPYPTEVLLQTLHRALNGNAVQ
ncbi:MAG TPA: hypothetical protein VGY56_03810 [Verrucomicrobiae bacterium]|nr:hypothetical protein [Verrucomicrobiae bacterium]